METQKKWRTADLFLAAYLKVAGVPFIEAVRENGRVYYLFDPMGSMRDLKNQYYNRTAKVVALTHSDEIKVMKALTHEDMG